MILLNAKICEVIALLSKDESEGNEMSQAIAILKECREYTARIIIDLENIGSTAKQIAMKGFESLNKMKMAKDISKLKTTYSKGNIVGMDLS